MKHFDSIPDNAEVFAVRSGDGAPVLNGDIVHDHDNGCWKFLSVVRAARVSDCRVTARHAVSGKLVTTSPTAFNLRIVWESETPGKLAAASCDGMRVVTTPLTLDVGAL